jgi:mRNA interferase RelE/StbE
VADVIRALHPELKRKVRTVLDEIREDPLQGKELKDDLSGLRSVRVAHFRIVYRIGARRVVEVVALGPRRTIYADTGRLLRRVREGEP